MTGYRAFLAEVLSHPVQGPAHAGILVDVTRNITGMENLVAMTGGDPEGLDGLIDAQLDRLIVASGGERQALFALAAALGKAMQALTGMS